MASPELKELFSYNRFAGGWRMLFLLFYSPLGITLVLIRLSIAIQAFLASFILSASSRIRSISLRVLMLVLGLVIREEASDKRSKTSQIIIANSISIVDHIAVHILTECSRPGGLLKSSTSYEFSRDHCIRNAKRLLLQGLNPVFLQPEGSTTNGEVGLLKFASWPFSLQETVQPVVIRIWRLPFFGISTSMIGASGWSDLFWFFFLPFSVVTVRFLNEMKRQPGEDEESFSGRVQKTMADEMNLHATDYTAKQKFEYWNKNKQKSTSGHMDSGKVGMSKFRLPTQSVDSDAIDQKRMIQMVYEVLPHVPVSIIAQDIAKTKSVDATISNILEVPHSSYLPAVNECDSTLTNSSIQSEDGSSLQQDKSSSCVQDCLESPSPPPASASFDTCAKTFEKTAKERMKSFSERKSRLLENARRRYVEKHTLNSLHGFNS